MHLHMNILNLKNIFLVIILISMAISPAFALGEGNRNLLLIGIMCISPIVVLIYPRMDGNDFLLLLFMVCIILFPLMNHPESMRWSTVLYSCMFCLTFMAYQRLLNQGSLTIEAYLKITKYLLYAYFIVLLIQQFCVLTGLPIFNLANYDPFEPWKLNSLAAEPSHSARIVALLMFCYITIKEIIFDRAYLFRDNFREDKWIWLAFVWTMVTMGSSTAFLFLPIVLLKFVRLRNLIPLMIILFGTYYLIDIFGLVSLERTYRVFTATLTLDEYKIIQADHSAAMRIVPTLICAKMIGLSTMNDWFGHGIDYTASFMYQLVPGIIPGTSSGGMFAFALEYGIITTAIFLSFSFITSFNRRDYLSIIFWILLVILNGINSQITWLAIILLFTNKYFQNLYVHSYE